MCIVLFFFNDTATTEIYTLSLHDALPIFLPRLRRVYRRAYALLVGNAVLMGAAAIVVSIIYDKRLVDPEGSFLGPSWLRLDRKSTRLNSSHANISYAVFCLKKKKTAQNHT